MSPSDINILSNIHKHNPLHIASYYGHLNIVKELVQSKKIDVEEPTVIGETCIHLALKSGNHDVCSLM